MNRGWIALHRGELVDKLQRMKPNAFLLLCQIARRARITPCQIEKLSVGEALLGDYAEAGLKTRGQYRAALNRLEKDQFITTRTTAEGTIAKLVNSKVFSLTQEDRSQVYDHQTTTEQPSNNHQTTTKKKERRKECKNPPLPPEGSEETSIDSEPTWLNIYPPGSRTLADSKKKQTKVTANLPLMIRMSKWFNRMPGTLWSVYEAITLQRLSPSEQEVDIMEAYYTSGAKYLRRDLATMLNNWQGEIDRAISAGINPQTTQQEEAPPEGWNDAHEHLYGSRAPDWTIVPGYKKREIKGHLKQ